MQRRHRGSESENFMKVVIVWILGPLIAFGMAAVAGTTYEERAEPEPSFTAA